MHIDTEAFKSLNSKMSQEEVLEVLKKEKLLTAEEIAEMLNISVMAVRNSLNRMLDDDVERIIIHIKFSRMSYAWKLKGIKIPREKLEEYLKNEK